MVLLNIVPVSRLKSLPWLFLYDSNLPPIEKCYAMENLKEKLVTKES
jgi:hypothetical protein